MIIEERNYKLRLPTFQFDEETIRLHEQMAEEAERRKLQDENARLVKSARIPDGYYRNLDTFIPDNESGVRALSAVRDGIRKMCGMIILLGGYGIGKSHLVCAALSEIIPLRKSVFGFAEPFSIRYVRSCEICELYERAKGFSSDMTRTQVIDGFASYDVLVIDEVGRCGSAETEKEVLFRLTDARPNKLTFYVGNMNFHDFSVHLGGATMDRLRKAYIVEMQGKSHRGM